MRALLLLSVIWTLIWALIWDGGQPAAAAPPEQGWQPGRYEDGRWIAGPVLGRYAEDGRWIAGAPAGRVGPAGLWVADPAPGYWDDQGRWRAGAVMGAYDEDGRWRTTAPGSDKDRADPQGEAAASPRPPKPSDMARPVPSR